MDEDELSEGSESLLKEIRHRSTRCIETRDFIMESVIPAAELILSQELQRDDESSRNFSSKNQFSEKLYESLSSASILPGQPRAIQLF